jgi:hypothetical protein
MVGRSAEPMLNCQPDCLELSYLHLQPRMLEVFKFLGVIDEVLADAIGEIAIQSYKMPGGTEKLPLHHPFPLVEETPAVPYVNHTHSSLYPCAGQLTSLV